MIYPLNLPGPQFFPFMITSLKWTVGFTILFLLVIRFVGRGSGRQDLHIYEMACLMGGGTRVVQAALIRLHRAGAIAYDAVRERFSVHGSVPRGSHPLERELLQSFKFDPTADPRSHKKIIRETYDSLEERLVADGVVRSAFARFLILTIALGPLLVLLSLALIKMTMGIMRGHPVSLLVLLVVVTCIAVYFAVSSIPKLRRIRLTPWGITLAKQIEKQHAALLATAKVRSEELRGADAGLVVAVFGIHLFESDFHLGAMIRQYFPKPAPGTGDGGSGGCGGGSSCGGGSGCGGGCGGCGG